MQGSNASWPVGGATRQSGGNWVGRFEKPEDWSIWASMYSSNLELGQLITVGDAILKWTASGVKFVDAVFATQADFDSFCSKIGTPIATGSTATVAGAMASWNGSAWGAMGGNVTPCYDTWAQAVAAAGTTLGWHGYVKRLCGNSYFHVMYNGTRLVVCAGESIIRDAGPSSAGYDLTATGTAYVTLASYTIPAGLIGDGEEWEVDSHAMSLDVHASGNDMLVAYIGGQLLRGSTPSLTAINQVCRLRGAFCRLSSLLTIRTGASTADLYSGINNTDVTVGMESEQTFTAGFVPGAATNKMRLRHVCLRRIG